ncbi:hypothetical protein [Clostridium intestinale]|uniref:SnoaL-like domain-containing protein n=1 Tax=Clostridium intestinale DSM 6191 TaxID=1121320 RepID=A0A1M5T4R0_9CLOT|nr:hypothetical protein [Clostridium intestinale]SHH45735.1 hypothetical protein SAMN02745941_00105 [Clostridium intestinale DSM 6191]
MSIEKFANEFWECVASQDKDELRKYFCEDATIRWHCTNECFSVDEYIIANCEYPGTWNGEVERIVQLDNSIITVTRVWDESMSFHATSFFIIENNKIKELDEYFGDDGSAPKWRLDKQIGKPIK